jgi:hypothetical protein
VCDFVVPCNSVATSEIVLLTDMQFLYSVKNTILVFCQKYNFGILSEIQFRYFVRNTISVFCQKYNFGIPSEYNFCILSEIQFLKCSVFARNTVP